MSEARAVLWDLDGTIVDSEEAHFLAWREAFAREGAELTRERFRELFGRKNEVTVRAMLGAHISDAEVERVAFGKEEGYRASVRAGGARLLPGVERMLEGLHLEGWLQAIVSSAPRANVETIVEALGIADYFGAVVGGEDVAAGKPDPACMLLAAERLGVDPRRCVVVEDAPAGLEAARRAGMSAVGVLTTHGELDADVATSTLEALDARALDELLDRR